MASLHAAQWRGQLFVSRLTCLDATVQNIQVVLSDEPSNVSSTVRGCDGVQKLLLSRS